MNEIARQEKLKIVIAAVAWGTIGVCVVILAILFTCFYKSGLTAEFYTGTNFETFIVTTNNKTINFVHSLEMDPRVPEENFSARWHGDLRIPEEGDYTFSLVVDDGARLFIDDQMVFDEWSDHDKSRFENTIPLAPGLHKIRLEYFNHLHGCALRLCWTKPDEEKEEVIPVWNLKPASY